MQEEQVSTMGTLNESSLDTDAGAAQGAMLLTVKAGKTLLRNHLALHQSLLPLSAGLSAAFLSVCLTSHQRLPRLLILILLLALAADQLTPDNDGQMLGYFGNVIWHCTQNTVLIWSLHLRGKSPRCPQAVSLHR